MSIEELIIAGAFIGFLAILYYGSSPPRSRSGKTRVSVEKVEAAREYLRTVNKIPLEDIVWTRQGRDIEVADEMIKDWKFVGLSNADFVELRLNGEQE